MTLSYKTYDLPLRHAFTISRYTVIVQKTVICMISDGEFMGYGEATANPYYDSTVKKLSASLESIKPIVNSLSLIEPAEFWKMIEPTLRHDYFALCATDIAYWDFYAKKMGKPLRRFFSDSDNAPMTSYTIGIDSVDSMRRKILEMPWPLYKIKLGTSNDLGIVRSLREITNATFRVDANAAWGVSQTIELSKELKSLGVEFIEQPLPSAETAGMKAVKPESHLPIIADESCQKFEDVEACVGQFDGINIKLMKCGGITPAIEMISQARKLGLKVMAGCMTESTVGISALCQIAPLLDFLDADGALLLASDIASGVAFSDGKIVWAKGNGTGAELY